jgi:hypothetical protein
MYNESPAMLYNAVLGHEFWGLSTRRTGSRCAIHGSNVIRAKRKFLRQMALAAVVEMFVRKGDDPPPEVHASIGGSSARAARFLVRVSYAFP